MLCILFAKNWAVLSIGWAVLALFILVGVAKYVTRPTPSRDARFELGPLISADFGKINRWIRPVAVFVLLLGFAGIAVSLGEEGPQNPGYAIFLIGIGVASLGIGYANRPLIVAGYGLCALAGAIVCYTAVSIENPRGMAQALTLGGLLFFGALLAVYGFLYGRTRIYEEGILLSNGICPWESVDSWALPTINDVPHLQIAIGTWKPVMAVRSDQTESLVSFLSEKFPAR